MAGGNMIRYLSKASHKQLRGVALLRLDFNTEDEWRMEATLPTVKLLARHAQAVVIVSHRGRPQGVESKLSLRKDSQTLSKALRRKVVFIPHFKWAEIKKAVQVAKPGSIFVLENIRFLPGETTPEPELAKQLAGIADYYVNDAFAVCHREADSVSGVEQFLLSYAGLELESEIRTLSNVLRKPRRPFVVILGGAKPEEKLGVVQYMRSRVDWFLLGGAAANTMLMLQGVDIRKSLIEKDPKTLAGFRKILKFKNVVIPIDYRFDLTKTRILDIGPRGVRAFRAKIRTARTILWSGAMGKFEEKGFNRGTLAIAKEIARNAKATRIAGGGETVVFLRKNKLAGRFDFLSTGGGALLEFLAGQKLPGIEALKKSKELS